jgi:Lipase (class 3)
MRPIALAVALFGLSLAINLSKTAYAQIHEESPDFDLAYVLATASYCAYAVGEADADHGQKRAVQCLKVASDRDRERLELFRNIEQENVEAFFNPSAPENAYLLIQTEVGVILAFRGTLTPPISPSAGRFPAALAEALAKYKEREATLLATFITDWKNNFMAIPDIRNRHSGFDADWSGLRAHLIERECGLTAPADCSKFLSFVSRLHDTASLRLYVTGHSKGGALATLAALDLPEIIGGDIVPVVYTFAGAKVLTADSAASHADTAMSIWRFEHEYDIVPSVPPDRTVILWPVYAHVGSRVPSGIRLEFGGGISGNMRLSFHAARSIG